MSGSVADADAGQVVRVARLSHFYGEGEARTQVLFDNDLDLAPGQTVVMTGKSGSGKTTLLTLIGALRSVQSGSVRVLGRELRGLGQRDLVRVRRGIGFIFQAHNLFASLTAFQNVRMALELEAGRCPPREIDRRVGEMLEGLGLDERMHAKPAKLSGGQRQRVAVARALVSRPRLVLADEPTAALDEESSRLVIALLMDTAHRDGTSVIIVTHDRKIIDVVDKSVNMSYGRILDGPCEDT